MTDAPLLDPSDPRALRDAFGCFATGITLVTTQTEDGPVGFIANSFSSLSLDPPLIMWALSNHARRRLFFENAEHFAVHVLRDDQNSVCEAFTSRQDAFDDLSLSKNADGVPVIDDCLARFDCQRYASYPGGDHQIILGQVNAFTHGPGNGLVYLRGKFFTA
ncbi:flavin reductase family protein [Actibacterium pelagium]|uniref:Flavin oxidoreductase n=1 Tax=Actibacterium pelagium TaxID=2029103 RepID=A0A917EMT1_9RHOB|nr:flavin reductase family protein [Actibacterium pelagium]GGE61058.1 flavin oxidoreductase [Actibacterium pelagium]